MDFDKERCLLRITEPGICTPFIDGALLYYGHHNGKSIKSVDLETGEERVEFQLADSECQGHISSPAVYDNSMVYHGPMRGGGGQRSFLAHLIDGRWQSTMRGPVGHPYMRKGPGDTWFAKNRGLLKYHRFGTGRTIRRSGPYRHCHYHDGWYYYSQWGEEEYIKRMKFGVVEDFYRPDIRYHPTSSGPARHKGEVRDPFINDKYFACIADGEQELRVWTL